MRLRWALALLLAVGLVAAACTDGDGGTGAATSTTVAVADGGGAADATPAPALAAEVGADGTITFTSGGEPFLRTVPVGGEATDGIATVAWRTTPYQVASKQPGLYLGHEVLSTPGPEAVPWTAPVAATVDGQDGGTVTATLSAADTGEQATISVEPLDAGIVRVEIDAPDTATEVATSFACTAGDRFYGFGAQTWATQHRGSTVPIWVVEQGLGKVTPETPQPAPSVMGEPYDSYVPMPFFWSPGPEGGPGPYGVSLDTTRYAAFELCTAEHPDTWRVRTWDDRLSYEVYVGARPLDVVERYTSVVGRPPMPPDWFFAPMNDAVRGQDNVARVAQLLRANDIPSSVIWTEDWIGIGSQATGFRLSHDWQVSPTEYPDLRALTDQLHADGFRFLGYVSPFIVSAESTPGGPSVDQTGQPVELVPHNQEKWAEAQAGGYYLTTPDGEPSFMLTPPFVLPGGTALDVTDSEAVQWFQGYLARAEALGLDGTMTDFGEWVPFDARFANGETGAELHNEYPVRWQQINREFWDEARPDGDYLFYVRSGFTGSQRWAPAFWGGDQNTSFDRLDGLASVVSLGVNLGMSGVPFYGHDIAGYSAFAIPGVENTPTTKELFLRWAAIGAYTPMMRTHHGSRYGENWSFEGAPNPAYPADPVDDPETLAAWKALAETHISLFPYQQAMAAAALERGQPIMLHPILLYPDDPNLQRGLPEGPEWDAFAAVGRPRGELFEYFFGTELLVAPVIDAGATGRPVYLPEGDWVDVATGERFTGPTTITAEAAPGEIPVYARAGGVVPRLPPGVETLAPTDAPGVVDLADVAGELVVDAYLGADGSFELADGTRFELTSSSLPDGAVRAEVDGEPADVVRDGAVLRVAAELAGDGTVRLDLGDAGSAELRVQGAPGPRTYTVRFVG